MHHGTSGSADPRVRLAAGSGGGLDPNGEVGRPAHLDPLDAAEGGATVGVEREAPVGRAPARQRAVGAASPGILDHAQRFAEHAAADVASVGSVDDAQHRAVRGVGPGSESTEVQSRALQRTEVAQRDDEERRSARPGFDLRTAREVVLRESERRGDADSISDPCDATRRALIHPDALQAAGCASFEAKLDRSDPERHRGAGASEHAATLERERGADGRMARHRQFLGGREDAQARVLAARDDEYRLGEAELSGESGHRVGRQGAGVVHDGQGIASERGLGEHVPDLGVHGLEPTAGILALMRSPLIDRYADLLLDYCCEVAPGDVVSLNVETPALDLARALFRGTLQRDARPLLRLAHPEALQDLVECAGEGFLASEPELELDEVRRTDAWIRVAAPSNRRALQDADPATLGRIEARMAPVTEARVDGTRWVGTLFPTDAGAQDAGMSLDAFERFVFGAMHLDEDDPTAAWRALGRRHDQLIARLRDADEIRIRAEGTDLRLRTGGRTWVNSDGRHNMPSGEVFTGPIEDSAEGTVRFDVPSFLQGRRVEGVSLRFEAGEVVEAHAEQGDDLLQERLARDPGARRLGELGIGTNDRIDRATGSTLFDEKIGGTVHLALGRSYASTGGVNRSSIHWDLIRDLRHGGEILLDGEPFQRDGRFLV